MKRRRNARLGVHLLWIVSSALVACFLATEVARERSAPDGSARAKPAPAASVLAKLLPREAGGEEEQTYEMAKKGSLPAKLSTSLATNEPRPAWEEMFEMRTRGAAAAPAKIAAPKTTAPTMVANATPAWQQAEVLMMRNDDPPLPISMPSAPMPMGGQVSQPIKTTPNPASVMAIKPVVKQKPGEERRDTGYRTEIVSGPPPATMGSQVCQVKAVEPIAPTPIDDPPQAEPIVPTPISEVPRDDNVVDASFNATFQTEEPPLPAPPLPVPPSPAVPLTTQPVAAKAPPPSPAVKPSLPVVTKAPASLLERIFTPAELPKAPESAPTGTKAEDGVRGIFSRAVNKKPPDRPPAPAKPEESAAKLPIPEMPPGFGKKEPKEPIDTKIQRAAAQTTEPAKPDSKILPVSEGYCADCYRRGGLPPHDGHEFSGARCATCGKGKCVPGRKNCYACEHEHSPLGGFFCDLYDCICCPDPCYDPKWCPLADAAFFSEGARPVTQSRFGWDSGRNMRFPDRSEYFWARADGGGLGPKLTAGALAERSLRYEEMTMYTETAIGGFSTFLEMPYRSMDPDVAAHAAGFGDMSVGTKSLLVDCELLLVTFQMKTVIPIGQTMKGLGTGHTTLEPSLLFALKLSSETYLQGQLSEWIPIGGNSEYAGSVFHSHFSLNHVLCRILPDVPLIGTLEVSTLTFQDGAYTDPVGGPFQRSSNASYITAGPGLRLFICDRVDFGVGTAFALTENHFAQTLFRTVFRFRF